MGKAHMKRETVQDEDAASLITVSQLPAVLRSEIAEQIAAARANPRHIGLCIEEARSLVVAPETAESCVYGLRREGRDGKITIIKGASIRFAEVLAYAWHNSRSAARIVDEGDRFITAQGIFVDVERNNVLTCDVQRRITRSNGKRYGDDMVMVTGNAACSIALRNAILRGIPKAIWLPIYDAAEEAAIGDVQRLPERRQKMLHHFAQMGVSEKEVLDYLKLDRLDAIGFDQLTCMLSVAQQIKEGAAHVDSVFRGAEAGWAERKVADSQLGDGRRK